MQILLQFYLDLFLKKKQQTLQLFLSRSKLVHVIGYDIVFFKYDINFFPNDGLVVQ